MTPERWQRINEILEQVEAAPERLDELCGGDLELREEVKTFLTTETDEAYLHGVIGEQAASFSTSPAAAKQERFGPYELIRRIGQGGMGAVFEAVRVDGFRKKVALKIIKQGLDSEYARTRFVQERQTLAGLEHPYIARLLDGGETDDGSPYLVLEFVDGRPITEFCATLDRVARLRLFLKICEAVEHAHRNLVVHRDLKPANILVNADGDPKLLDFGIAKLLDGGTSQTQTAFAALTPDYASPEQIRGEPITTASDIYSLGVILYQLLTGRKPYAIETGTPLEMDRVICQQPPASPGLGDELDHILLMALRKEPERRYAGVQRLAEDIERYLANRPVSARPDTVRYRAKKFVRRNWWQIAAVALLIASLGAGLGLSLAEQRRTQRRFNEVRQLANTFLFDFHDEIVNVPGTVKAREMIVSTALKYLNSLAADAAGDPGLQWEMAEAYSKVAKAQGSTIHPSLRRRGDAKISYEKALALARPVAQQQRLSKDQLATFVNMLCDTESIYRSLAEFDAAQRLGREAVDWAVSLPDRQRWKADTELATTLGKAGDLAGSIGVREKVVPSMRELLRREPIEANRRMVAGTLVDLGYFQGKLTRFADSVASGEEALGILRVLVQENPRDPRLRVTLFNALFYLGLAQGAPDRPSLGNTDAAVALFEEAVKVMDVQIKADANDKASRVSAGLAHNHLANLLMERSPAESLRHSSAATRLLEGASENSRDDWGQSRVLAAGAYRHLRQFGEAENALHEAERIMKGTEATVYEWAELELARGNKAAAVSFAKRAIAAGEKELAKTPTPGNAWLVVQTLQLAAKADPAAASAYKRRIHEVWTAQNQRFPGVPYLQKMQETSGRGI